MTTRTRTFLCALMVCGAATVATLQTLAAPARTQSFFFRTVTKNNSPEVSHTIGVVAPSQAIAEEMALEYAEATWGGSGWYIAGQTVNHGEVNVNGGAAGAH